MPKDMVKYAGHGNPVRGGIRKKVVPDFSSRRIGIAPDRRGTMAVKGILEVQRHFFGVENTLDPAIRK